MNKFFLSFFLIFYCFILLAQEQVGFDIDGETAGDRSGCSVSLSSNGDIVAIGAYYGNKVCVYKNESGNWFQIGNTINGEASGDNFGYSVSLSNDGTIVAVGARYNDGNGSNSGHVRIYKNESDAWVQVGNDIDGGEKSENSGYSVKLNSNGTIVAIGAYRNSEIYRNSGKVRIYENNSDNWIQIGNDINGYNPNDYFGCSVSLNGDGSIVAIGAYGYGSNEGQVRIYKNNSGNWTQIGSDIIGEISSYLGCSVDLNSDGNIVAIGAKGNDSGHVEVYENISNTWIQIGSDILGETSNDNFGWSLDLNSDGNILAIGATTNDGNGNSSGHARVYKNESGNWTQVSNDIDGEASGDKSGYSVSLSSDGGFLAVGAINNDGNGNNSGHVRIFLTGLIVTQIVSVLPIVSIITFLIIGFISVLSYLKKV